MRGGDNKSTSDSILAYSLSNSSAKNYQNRLMCIEVIVCNISVFLSRHSIYLHDAHIRSTTTGCLFEAFLFFKIHTALESYESTLCSALLAQSNGGRQPPTIGFDQTMRQLTEVKVSK